jgi:type III pantothenate kinase
VTLLVVDVGNSSTSLGVYQAGQIRRTAKVETARLGVRALQAAVRQLAADEPLAGAVWASVVPDVNDVIERVLDRSVETPALRVQHTLALGARLTYPDVASIGEDRLANVAGAVWRYGAPVIVVDIGTATTFDIIRPRQGYTGGIIAPGPALMLEYLAEKTALLPRIDLRPVKAMVGKTTEQAMRIGALHGYQGMVKEITQHLIGSLRGPVPALCATGGYAQWVLRGMDLPFVYDRHLTLYGLAQIFALNRGADSAKVSPAARRRP